MPSVERVSRRRFLEMIGAGATIAILGCTPPPEVPVPESSPTSLPPKPPTPLTNLTSEPTLIPTSQQKASPPELSPSPAKQEVKRTELKILWQDKIEKSIFKSSPPGFRIPIPTPPFMVQNESLFLTRAQNHKFIKVNLGDGKPLWRDSWDLGGIPLAVTKNTVWVLRTGEDRLYGLDIKDGEKHARIDFESPLDNIPMSFDGKLFLTTRKDLPGASTIYTIHIVDQETGQDKTLPSMQVNSGYSLRIKTATSRYVVLATTYLHPDALAGIIDLETNSTIGQQQGITESVVAGMVGEDKIVLAKALYRYGALIPNNLEVLDLTSIGKPWTYPQPTKWPPFYFSKDIILVTNQKQDALIAIDPNSGKELWVNDEILPKQVIGVNENQVVLATDNSITALAGKDGTKRLWKYDLGDFRPNGVNCAGVTFGKEFAFYVGKNFQGNKRLVFRNIDGSQGRSDLQIGFDPKQITASGNFLIVGGENDLAIVG